MSVALPKPIKKQREVLYMPTVGHSVVLGTAGSGKTTLALYRAAYLSNPSLPHSGKTLLLTFNKTLVTYLNYLKPSILNNVNIETYHTFARGYLDSRGKMNYNCICSDPDKRKNIITKAVSLVSSHYASSRFFDRPIEFFMDEIQWIFSQGITTVEEYVVVERIGRIGTNLSRKLRPIMFQILKTYVSLRNQHGFLYDWDDIAQYVRAEFLNDNTTRIYRHIIIDEGQDFSPEMIRSLAAAIPSDGSLTFFGDVAQQIYGQRMSWRSSGLYIPQQWFFKENYRNTKQISQLGLAISQMPYFNGIPDLVVPTSWRADGPLPTLVKCINKHQQIELSLQAAKNFSKTKSVAVLFKNRDQELQFSSLLGIHATRLHRDLNSWHDGSGVFFGTYHSAKGLEFDSVILPFLDSDNLPDKDHIASDGEEDALTHAGRLLYVAVTRAKTDLILLYSDSPTVLLPIDSTLYQVVNQ